MSQETTRSFAVVKWFNPKAGYGFLTDVDSNADVFVHHNGIKASDNVYKTLSTGEYVEYETTQDASGKTLAVNVTGLRGGKLLCEHPKPKPRAEKTERANAPARKNTGKRRPRSTSKTEEQSSA